MCVSLNGSLGQFECDECCALFSTFEDLVRHSCREDAQVPTDREIEEFYRSGLDLDVRVGS